ncbi:trigger factor [Candidatus Parcubacteria bacterium]|nr:MAG: trigger factor [Candidatus Parcubacteria bacterium]
MQVTKKELEKNQIELSIEVSEEELKPHLEKAAQKLSAKNKLPGFRPGKAPYELVKNQFGEMTILQEAVEFIVSDFYYKAVVKEDLKTVGQPEIKMDKLAPGNPVIFKAVVSLLPKVTLGEWQKAIVKKKEAVAQEEDINKTIDQLSQMNVKETVVERAAKKNDKVELDFEVLINNAVIEGGKNPRYPIVLGEGRMIPGFEDQVIGLKTGAEKKFELKFPEKYFQKNLAGKIATFKVKVLAVYEREMPKLDDSLAKMLGFDTLEKLKEQIKENISQDKQAKENQRVESEAIQEVIKASQIADLPENLIHNEIHKMMHEMEHNITSQGMDMSGYLKSMGKTETDLHKDFRPQAIERVKAALVLRQISVEEKIGVDDNEVEEELKKQKEMYKSNPEAIKNISLPAYKQHLINLMINQKVVKFITDKIVK